MATPPKFIRFPFAATGDKETIPDEAQASGSLSYSEGFGLDYERDPTKDAKAKRMPRGGTNQVLYDATSNIQQYQLYGVPYWYEAASNGGTAIQYQKNAMVRFATGNSENIYISLKDNNTDIPTIEASWFLFQPYNATLLSRLSIVPFVPIESMMLTIPPASPVQGKAYLVPANATGLWNGKAGQLAEWDDKNWLFTVTPNGHCVGLSDGRVFTKVDGTYIEKIAIDSQSGKWNYAEAGGTANALIATISPAPLELKNGFLLQLSPIYSNTGPVQLTLNTYKNIPVVRMDGTPLKAGDLGKKIITTFIYNESTTCWQIKHQTDWKGAVKYFSVPGKFQFVVPEYVNRLEVEIWAGGGGGGACSGLMNNFGSTGGGGGYSRKIIENLTPGQIIPIVVGSGGKGGSTQPALHPTSGGSSSFGAFMSATGGGAGESGFNTLPTSGGVPGTGVGGDLNIAGGWGALCWVSAGGGIVVGAAGGSYSNPPRQPGTGNDHGSAGPAPGDGGGGAVTGQGWGLEGGDGAAGLIIVRW